MKPDVSVAVQTLVAGGFLLDNAITQPGHTLLYASRYDEFGCQHKYCFLFSQSVLSQGQVTAANKAAVYRKAKLVIITQSFPEINSIDWIRFLNLFGGPVSTIIPLDPDFGNQLVDLGKNKLPDRLVGKPDDLYEQYTQKALEFIFGGRVIRYGQERLFESVSDGIILNKHFCAIYDAKAYEKGYEITSDTILRFKSYVNEFYRRYQTYIPRIHSFIVVSSKFTNREKTLIKRSIEMNADCGVPLSFLTSSTLAKMIGLTLKNTRFRTSINWARIFAEPIVQHEKVILEIARIQRDQIIPKV